MPTQPLLKQSFRIDLLPIDPRLPRIRRIHSNLSHLLPSFFSFRGDKRTAVEKDFKKKNKTTAREVAAHLCAACCHFEFGTLSNRSRGAPPLPRRYWNLCRWVAGANAAGRHQDTAREGWLASLFRLWVTQDRLLRWLPW